MGSSGSGTHTTVYTLSANTTVDVAGSSELYYSIGPYSKYDEAASFHYSGSPGTKGGGTNIWLDHSFGVINSNFNTHIISGNMVWPWFISTDDDGKGHSRNRELLPREIISPIILSLKNITNDALNPIIPNDINHAFTPFKSKARAAIYNTSRVLNDMIVDIDNYGDTDYTYRSDYEPSLIQNGSRNKNLMIGIITKNQTIPNYTTKRNKLYDALPAGDFSTYKHSANFNALTVDGNTNWDSSSGSNWIDWLQNTLSGTRDTITLIGEEQAALADGKPLYLHPENSYSKVDLNATSSTSWNRKQDSLSLLAPLVSATGSSSDELATSKFHDAHYEYNASSATSDRDKHGMQLEDGALLLHGILSPRDRLPTAGMSMPIGSTTFPRGGKDVMFFSTGYGDVYDGGNDDGKASKLNYRNLSRYSTITHLAQVATGEWNCFLGRNGNSGLSLDSNTTNDRNINHSDVVAAEMFFKPTIYLDAVDVDISSSTYRGNSNVSGAQSNTRRKIKISAFSHNGHSLSGFPGGGTYSPYTAERPDSNTDVLQKRQNVLLHRWIQFSPNLTGYYLVSEVGKKINGNNVSTSNRAINDSTPTHIHKIISHTTKKTVTEDGSGREYIVHILEIDNANSVDTDGFYRVMRISQDTFYDFTPNNVDLLTLTNRYSKMSYEDNCYKIINRFNYYDNGYDSSEETLYNEGLLSMYLPINVDDIDGDYIDIRDISNFVLTAQPTDNRRMVNGETYNMSITDGHSRHSSDVSVSRVNSSPLVYSLNINSIKAKTGVVSFGEIFTLTTHVKPKLNSEPVSSSR